jgi:hypothetical protein
MAHPFHEFAEASSFLARQCVAGVAEIVKVEAGQASPTRTRHRFDEPARRARTHLKHGTCAVQGEERSPNRHQESLMSP